MTTLDPGAREVLTHGLEVRPRSTALRASSPAASITDGVGGLGQLGGGAGTHGPWVGEGGRAPMAVAQVEAGAVLQGARDPLAGPAAGPGRVGLEPARRLLVVV